MTQVQPFHVGDRISTKCPLNGLPIGSFGTVQLVFMPVPGVYDVLFDPIHPPRITFQSDLTLIALARQADAV